MKQFFKFTFASCLGVLLSMIALFFLLAMIGGGIAEGFNKTKKTKSNSVLRLQLKDQIPEKTNNVETGFSISDPNNSNIWGVHDISYAIEQAAEDNNIKGILLDFSMIQAGSVTRGEIRDAILKFKESGKFIYSYAKNYTQGAYHLATTANKVYVNPLGGIDFKGYGANIMFYKNMLEKAGIKMQIYYAGDFKGATEPYRLDKLSEKNKQQIREYVNDLYDEFIEDVSVSRGVSKEDLKKTADQYLIRQPSDAVKYGLADQVAYFDEVITAMKSEIGLDEDDKLNVFDLKDYVQDNKRNTDFKVKDKIAVIYAEGTILEGPTELGSIGDDKYTKIIRKIRNDDKIKAVVIRVNSGGGSALASENIWRELKLVKAQGIPVIASMGDVAASGGYYISAAADTIVAESNTITGSIGVFSMIPSVGKLFNDKLGITFDTVLTGRMAAGLYENIYMDHNDLQKEILQNGTDTMYNIFLNRVAQGRDMTKDAVHEIAQGRVWSGDKALNNGLVDVIGDLDDAITIAANSAGLENYNVKEYPTVKDPTQQLIDKLTGKSNDTDKIGMLLKASDLNEFYPFYQEIKEIKQMHGVQAKMPYYIDIK
jgi:protease-4